MLPERTSLGNQAAPVLEAAKMLQLDDIVARIWAEDHTVWRDDPAEISNRLGWLTVSDDMRQRLPDLRAFADQAKADGIQHVLLLAMGGSALAPEVYRAYIGTEPGYPRFTMIDSTVPGWVQKVTDSINPGKTLFILGSKSGSTVEVLTFYRYFRAQVLRAVGDDDVGNHFAAITDEGTILHDMGQREGFRRVFLNPSNIGGRFSGLSLFGLVPAALMGIDLDKFLDNIDSMREQCGPAVEVEHNPGAWLGTVIGTLAKKGVDKLTLVTSPSLASFGLWTEQMLAESLGKEGTGIIPVAAEPMVSPENYDNDRFFVYLRLKNDNNTATDAHLEALRMAGFTTICLHTNERIDLAGEMFRWAFATSVAGHILGLHPFDQPNVQKAKDIAVAGLQAFQRDRHLPPIKVSDSVERLLAQIQANDYLALLVYATQSAALDEALVRFRKAIVERYHIATTAAYGPRYLHSTGQLHKGGPNSGLFLQFIGETEKDIPVPGQPHTFGVLADAQSQGDIKALQEAGRRVARYSLGSALADNVDFLTQAITAR